MFCRKRILSFLKIDNSVHGSTIGYLPTCLYHSVGQKTKVDIDYYHQSTNMSTNTGEIIISRNIVDVKLHCWSLKKNREILSINDPTK